MHMQISSSMLTKLAFKISDKSKKSKFKKSKDPLTEFRHVYDDLQSSEISSKMITWKKFCIPCELIKALYEKQYFEPTEIQSKSLGPAILEKRDILGAAETGSGKTLAFGIPIVSGILKLKEIDNSLDDYNDEFIEK